jgi:17beta-estradiol 17-dehydrogenase / very-long-chain 3-oxoacyl-CoA reductase
MVSLTRILLYSLAAFAALEIILLLSSALRSAYYHLCCPEVDYQERYGHNAWMVITGGSSGQGRELSLQWAARGFNIMIIGSKRSFDVAHEIERRFPGIQVRVEIKDFSNAFKDGFFDSIERAFSELPRGQVAAMIHSVGHRVAFAPYHAMPLSLMRDTIAVGTFTQAAMARIALPYLRSRSHAKWRSVMISITAQCLHPTFGPGVASSPELCVPYLSVYESANVFGYFHATSLWKEYKRDPTSKVDHLIITPGAVLTQNTASFLSDAPGAVTAETFVASVMRLTGNVEGPWSGSWKQGLSLYLINLFPPVKDYILHQTGAAIADGLMSRDQTRKRRV